MIGLFSEAVGFVLIKKGLAQVPVFTTSSLTSFSFLVSIMKNPQVLVGTSFEALHFGVLRELLSVSDVSYISPLTSIGYILTPIFANIFLHEAVPPLRWAGISLICAGVIVLMRKS